MPRAARLNLPLCLSEVASEMDLREAKDANGCTVLYVAAAKGRLEVCRFLVEESELDVNCSNADGECRRVKLLADESTASIRAAAAGEVGVLRYLLDHGGDPAKPDAIGFMPLHIAAENGASLPLMDGSLLACCL